MMFKLNGYDSWLYNEELDADMPWIYDELAAFTSLKSLTLSGNRSYTDDGELPDTIDVIPAVVHVPFAMRK